MLSLIDTHAHLDEMAAADEVVNEARSAGVTAVIAVGSDLKSNQRVLELAGAYPGYVLPALGLHPWNLADADLEADLRFIRENIDSAIAIGEVGLDYDKRVRARVDKQPQIAAFRRVLELAAQYQKPALVHSRYAWRDALTVVEEAGVTKAVFHWYTGTSSVLREIVERGYFISATPAVEYHEEHRRVVKGIPLDRLLLETDSPVVYRRGTADEYRASPASVVRVLQGTAALLGVAEADIARVTTANAVRMFGLSGLYVIKG
jgi:TatD DNase family protein